MQWAIDNWVLILLVGGMLAMHMFGHGHGHGKKGAPDNKETAGRDKTDGGPEV